MKCAFIIMGDYAPGQDVAAIGKGQAQIVGVASVDAACAAAKRLQGEGVDVIELCGAFGEAGARQVIAATENQLPVGFTVHLPEQDPLFDKVFPPR